MKKIFLLLLTSFSLFCVAQNNPRKIIFQKSDVITNVEEYNKRIASLIDKVKKISLMTNNIFDKEVFNKEETNRVFDSLKIEISKNIDVGITNDEQLFLSGKLNDSIFMLKTMSKNDTLHLIKVNRFVNVNSKKYYYNFPYSINEYSVNLKYDKIENLNLVEDKNQTKTINGIKTYKVTASYTKINPAKIDNYFPEFNEPETKDSINLEMWVTSEIKHFYHPIINVKEIVDKYYPLELKITNSSIPV